MKSSSRVPDYTKNIVEWRKSTFSESKSETPCSNNKPGTPVEIMENIKIKESVIYY